MEPYVKQIKKGVIRMTGYLPYLIEKHGYSEEPVILVKMIYENLIKGGVKLSMKMGEI